MRLADLYPDTPGGTNITITALCEDSRRAIPGAIFFAHSGSKKNGLSFISSAIMAGCVAIIVPEDTNTSDFSQNIPHNVPIIPVKNTRADIARCAAIFYSKQPRYIFAVTGTSGKTSVTYFIQQLCNQMNKSAVSIGTIGVAGAISRKETLTTPEAPELHALLNDVAQQGINYAAIEASSQAIIQHRIDKVSIHAAAFTNLSQDHLDYHQTIENYFAAKLRLFSEILPQNGTAVLNFDDQKCADILKICRNRGIRTITYGTKIGADIYLNDHTLTPNGQRVTFTFRDTPYTFDTTVAGKFQATNMLCALALVTSCGFSFSEIIKHLGHLVAPPGRLEPITGHPNGAQIYVDYAHKPDALLNVLQELRAHHPRRLSVVFGCGGDRDTSKRALMGDIAARYADDIIITDDNPRSEDPSIIRRMIIEGAHSAHTRAIIHEIADRRTAIHRGISELKYGDILVIAGKGHEQGQKFKDYTEPFDDRDVVRDVLKKFIPPTLSSPLPKGRSL